MALQDQHLELQQKAIRQLHMVIEIALALVLLGACSLVSVTYLTNSNLIYQKGNLCSPFLFNHKYEI